MSKLLSKSPLSARLAKPSEMVPGSGIFRDFEGALELDSKKVRMLLIRGLK
jgi:hypothetical protein